MLRYIIVMQLLVLSCTPLMAKQSLSSQKRERSYIHEGNKLYNDHRYSEAEIAFRKALQENEASEVAQFNLASALLHQISLASGQEDGNKTEQEALQILNNLSKTATNSDIAENSFYNLGNVAFNKQQYQQSIDYYKNALRKNPDNDKARENLRLAQLKLEEQQNQNQDQQQNKDQQNQEQQQDQQEQQQEQQNQDQEQEQNQDQNQNSSQKQDQQQQDKQEQGGISDRNAEQILKAMENQENATRKKIDELKIKEEQKNANRNKTDKPW